MSDSNSDSIMYKLIACYSYAENYAAHDWDGIGNCPQYWKNKGGEEDVLFVGITLEMSLDPEFQEWATELARAGEYRNDFAEKSLWDFSIQHIDQLTWLEQMEAEYEEDYEYLECFPVELDYPPENTDNDPIDRFDALADNLGFGDMP